MNTIRLPAIARNERLEWGSSEWAAESCLADWSTLERQWLGVDERKAAQAVARRRTRKRFVASLVTAAGLAVACTPALWPVLAATLQFLSPALAWLAELLPQIALGFGVLVLAGVPLGLWRDSEAAAPQPSSLDGAG